MNPRTLDKLELPAVRALLASECACSLGKERAAALTPSNSRATVAQRLAETSEAREILDRASMVPFGGITDTREAFQRARLGSTLSPHDLLAVGDCLRGMRRLKASLQDADPSDYPRVRALELRLAAFRAIEDRIDATVDDNGHVLDSASAELRRIRGRVRTLRMRIEEKARHILASHANDPALQDRLVTVRRGRPCIPVKASAKRSFPGVVHDISGSGATVFIEPEGLVGDGDALQQALALEEEEVSRILRELSALVGADAEQMTSSLEAAGLLDAVFARGRLSQRMEGVAPVLSESGHVKLIHARHPLIPPATVVPNDIYLGGEDAAALVITGPNTGGKTVVLKTVGLLALMAQSGLHVPADRGSELPVFPGIYADIGDEQSIAQSLSTFSSHMGTIAGICKRARPGVLVLLDEIGAGTDPVEGAALAQAVLRFLRDRGCLAITTTHYSSLKVFALNEPGLENASVEFDSDTLAPTFRLLIGVPGSSNAMVIASRLGLNSDVIREARRMIGDETVDVQKVLTRLERARRAHEREQSELEGARTAVERERDALAGERAALAEERERARRDGFAEARTLVEEARSEAREILRGLREERREGKATQAASVQLAELQQAVERLAEEEYGMPPSPPPDVAAGDTVHIRSLGGRRGVVLAAPEGGHVRIACGAVQMEVEWSDIEVVHRVADSPLRDQVGALKVTKAMTVPLELDLRGHTVDEAIASVDKFLDDAVLAEHEEVRLIHGKGSGALRQGLRRHLAEHPAVRGAAYAPLNQGGDGVTVVRL